MVDVILDVFGDYNNLEEPCSLSRLIQLLNPKLEQKKGKDEYYKFRDLFKDIYFGLIGEFVRKFLEAESLEVDNTPSFIALEKDKFKRQKMFNQLIRIFVINSHAGFSGCSESISDCPELPLFYPHHEYLRPKYSKLAKARPPPEYVPDLDLFNEYRKKQVTRGKKNTDEKNQYCSSLMEFLGVFYQIIDSTKEANGLDCFLLQKHILKIVQATGHKNYATSIASFKQIVLGHINPKYSHKFMWNLFAGRPGTSNKMPRDQNVEHLNRFLKQGFKALGVNLNEKNAKRINNTADIGQTVEFKVSQYFDLDVLGKSHTPKDRSNIVKILIDLFKKEQVTLQKNKRKFRGPNVRAPLENNFDDAEFVSWHFSKTEDLKKFLIYKDKD